MTVILLRDSPCLTSAGNITSCTRATDCLIRTECGTGFVYVGFCYVGKHNSQISVGVRFREKKFQKDKKKYVQENTFSQSEG